MRPRFWGVRLEPLWLSCGIVAVVALTLARANAESPDADPPAGFYAAEAMPLVTKLMTRAGISGYELLTVEEAAQELPGNNDGVFRASDVVGGLIVAPDADPADADSIIEYYESHDVGLCEGKFAYHRLPDFRTPVLKRLVTACSAERDGWERHYTLFRRAKGGLYMMMVMSSMVPDGGWPVRAFDARVLEAIETLD